MGEFLTLQMTGDLILDEPNPDALFDLARQQLHACDVLVGHVEVPHTARGIETHFDVPAPASDPAHLAALQRAGFHVATLAGITSRTPDRMVWKIRSSNSGGWAWRRRGRARI